MKSYVAPLALTAEGWQEDYGFSVDDAGNFCALGGKQANAQTLDGILLPGMPNLHSHAFQRAMAGLTERRTAKQDSFWTWRSTMYDFVGKFTPEILQSVASQLYVEMLKMGYTSVGEFHYLHHQSTGQTYDDKSQLTQSIFDAADETGIALTHLPVLYQTGGFGGQAPNDGQKPFINRLDQFMDIFGAASARANGDANKTVGVAPHSLRAVTLEQLDELLKVIPSDAPIHIHIAEQTKEVNDCLAWCGQTPVELLLRRFPVDQRWCAIHATHMTTAETKDLANSGAVAGLCPITEVNLGDGVFRLRAFLRTKGSFGVGSDSNVLISLSEELRTLEYSLRLKHRKRSLATTPEDLSPGSLLYKQAVAGGAQALGRKTGKIAEGYRADFIVLDKKNPGLIHHKPESVLDAVVFGCSTNPVKHVMVGGDWKITDGTHNSEQEIFKNYSRALSKLIN
jgi:formimidoylglutamate deiminase